jgi:hypothetical protein
MNPSWGASSRSATQEFPNILWNPKLHYRVRNSPELVPTHSQISPVHNTPPYLSKMNFNIILQLRLGFQRRPLYHQIILIENQKTKEKQI